MSLPSTSELEPVIVDILSKARDEGQLNQLTVRIVRQNLATHFDLKEDVLNGGDYKSFIKDTVHTTVTRLQNASEGGGESPAREPVKKEKSVHKAKTSSRKTKSKVRVDFSGEGPAEKGNTSDGDDELPSKKASTRPKTSKSAKSSKKPESEIQYKSKAIIESSDDESTAQKPSVRSPKKKLSSKKMPPPEQHAKNKDDSDVKMDYVEGPGPLSSASKPKRTTESPKPLTRKATDSTRDPMESELSSVVDEPPKKRQKQEKESAKLQKDEKTNRGKKKETLSKDEETVNKLKSIVIACGVRKVWKKEFEGLDKPSQQIKRLRSILGDLGMTSRYTLERAKALREQRELAQELKDVQEFEKATKRRGTKPRSSSETGESASREDSEADSDMPVRKKQNARASIMAFLEDQSEED
ncbi:hypothetical protein JVU11DRAFT_6572 [Chiua virens]|nr:hypothetical protein JVU11DRAFT_6572 [Chiua virens]